MYGILFLLSVCSAFCDSEAVLKTTYTGELCYNTNNPLIHLRYNNTGILTSLSSEVIDNCKIILLPKPSWSLVLSIYKYNINEDEYLIIEDSDGQKLPLIGRGYFRDEKKAFISDDAIIIHYKKNSTFDPSNHVKFQFTFTQVHSGPCSNDEFRCRNGKCLAQNLVCDRHNHCGDRSNMEKCDFPHSYNRMTHQDGTENIKGNVNILNIITAVSSVLLAIIILVFAAVSIHGIVKLKKGNSKAVLPTVAATVRPNPQQPTNDLQPKDSTFTSIQRSFHSAPKPKVELEQKTNEPNLESYQVPALYPEMQSVPVLIHGTVMWKKENSKAGLPIDAATVPSNPASTNDLQPKESAFARIRRSFRATLKPKLEQEHKTDQQNSVSYQVPAMYPEIPSTHVLIHETMELERENSKSVSPTVSATVLSNPAPTNDLQPKESAFVRIRRSSRSASEPKVEQEQKTNEQNSESFQVPAIYPQIPSPPSRPDLDYPDFQPE